MVCAFPVGGIQDNTVNRLLLMSSCEKYLPSVPMAFCIEQVLRERAPPSYRRGRQLLRAHV